MSDLIFAKTFSRNADNTFILRGDVIPCVEASGRNVAGGIGWGKIVMDYHTFTERENRITPPFTTSPQNGDWVVAWSVSPTGEIQRIAEFIVDKRQYKAGRMEISGPDKLAELQELPAVWPIGGISLVQTKALSMGVWEDHYPPPAVNVTLDAVYAPRSIATASLRVAGKTVLEFASNVFVQETDTVEIVYEDGELFQSTVVGYDRRMTAIDIADPLTRETPIGTMVYFYSTRIKVEDGEELVEGERLMYVPEQSTGGRTQEGYIIIDRVEEGEDDNGNPVWYVYTVKPITEQIADGASLIQFIYDQPTTSDVDMLLANTGWGVRRADEATQGTTYAPKDETIFDVLLAIADTTGYTFRAHFEGFSPQSDDYRPSRLLEYFPYGSPPNAPTLTTIGTLNTRAAFLDTAYGEIINLEYEDANPIYTHLIPRGGGGGATVFDFSEAAIDDVLQDYPTIQWGVLGDTYYIYNSTFNSNGLDLIVRRPVWAMETFSHISPEDMTSRASRREAAELLLRAACDWLLAHNTEEIGYIADVYTLGTPRVGDSVTVAYNNIEAGASIGGDFIINEVEHKVTADSGLRLTRLSLSYTGRIRVGSEEQAARSILTVQRALRRGNFTSGGGVGVSYPVGGGNGVNEERGGDYGLISLDGDVNITATAGDVNITGETINVTGSLTVSGSLHPADGVVLSSEGSADKWRYTAFRLRGIPRLMATYEGSG